MNFQDSIIHAISESFIDTWSAFPILLILYFILEWYGHSNGFNIFNKLNLNNYFSPVLGALLGLIPQCGIGVLLTGLYLRGMISTGTILAVYVATSDEALIVMLAHLENMQYILSIIVIKIIFASLLGILIDNVFKMPRPQLKEKFEIGPKLHTVKIEPHHSAGKHNWQHLNYKTLFIHAFKHSLNIYSYIFFFSILLFISFGFIDMEKVPVYLSKYSYIEILGATFFGLIPNCIASVAIAEAFLYSSLSFGAVIAGLSSAAGLGLIMLFKEAKINTALRIISILIIYSALVGFLINSIYPLRLPPSKKTVIEHIH